MKFKQIFSCILVVFAVAACSSSDETTQHGTMADSLAQRRRGTAFTTNQDTVVASVVKKSTTTRSASASGLSANLAFTVQVGAFTFPQHALRAQQLAKERFGSYPVFNRYEASLKLYRVSIGKFDVRDDAIGLLRDIVKLHPKEYGECWVNTIAK